MELEIRETGGRNMSGDEKKNMTTSQLLTLIRKADSFEEVLFSYQRIRDPRFSDVLYALMEKKKVKSKKIIQESRMERSYYYHLLSGKKNPGRNIVLRIALCMQATLDETNYLLKVSGHSGLYAKVLRDATLIYAITQRMNMDQANALLLESNQEPLFMEESNE